MKFGDYIKEKRQSKNITLRAFADMIHIAPAYMSDIEKSKRNAPTQEILERMSEALQLSSEEKNKLFDLAASSKDSIALDLNEYVRTNENVRVALRKAKDLNLGDEEWIKIIEEMIKMDE